MRFRTMEFERWSGKAALTLVLGLALGTLGGCDDLLDVDLPAKLTDEALSNPASAETQIASVIALFGCGYSAFAYHAMGDADVWESIAGVASGNHVFEDEVLTGDCDSDSEDDDYGDQISSARAFAYEIYDKLQDEWTVQDVPNKEELSAVAALHAAASLDVLGEHVCELTVDGGELMTPNDVLALAEDWVDTALGHISNAGGDFEMPMGISSSAQTMAYGLRSRIRWAMGNTAGALSDAEQVPQGFMAWVPRDAGPTLRNKIYDAGTAIGFSGMLDINDWWDVADRTNPVTGQPWPNPIPFTGYLNLGIMPDGRAVMDNGLPVRYDGPPEHFLCEHPDCTVQTTAVEDTRVQHFIKSIQGPQPRDVPDKYKSEDEDIPLVNWKEMWLIRAEIEGGQTAIDMVNTLRNLEGLPQVTYADPNDAEEIRYMVFEERRRELFAEGRFWSTKIQNTDIFWFPRSLGVTPAQGYALQGAVRLVMPEDEYRLNENLTLSDRGTGCDPSQQPGPII